MANKSSDQQCLQSKNSAKPFQQHCLVLIWGWSTVETFFCHFGKLAELVKLGEREINLSAAPDKGEDGFNLVYLKVCDIECQQSVSSHECQLLQWWKLAAGITPSVALINQMCGIIHPEAFILKHLSLLLDSYKAMQWFLLKEYKSGQQVKIKNSCIKTVVPASMN